MRYAFLSPILTAVLLATTGVVVCMFALPQCGAGEYRFSRPILIPQAEGEDTVIVAVTLPDDVFAAARSDLADLRILDGQGREIPRLIRPVVSQEDITVRRFTTLYPGAEVRLEPHSDGILEATLVVPDGHPQIEGLRIGTPLRDFEQLVSIYTSRDGNNWEALVENETLCDYSQWMDVRNLEIRLPRPASRYLRLVFSNPTVEREREWRTIVRRFQGEKESERTEETQIQRQAFRVDRIESWHNVTEAKKSKSLRREVSANDFRVETGRSDRETLVFVKMARRPLAGLIVETKDRNFRRRVHVQVPDPRQTGQGWRTVASDYLIHLDLPGYKQEDLQIEFPEQRVDEYRLVIENGDNPPLEIIGIRGMANVYQAIFLAERGDHSPTEYRLYYGDELATPPEYDTKAMEVALSRHLSLVEAELGPAEEMTVSVDSLARVWRNLNTSTVLTILVIVLATVMGWTLYRAAQKHPPLPEE